MTEEINKTTLMEFPCNFQLKIIGNHNETFEPSILEIVRRHFPTLEAESHTTKKSEKGNYLAISITVLATDQPSLDALYRELTSHPDVKMVF